MKISAEQLKQRINHFKEVLKRSGVKITYQRMEIFREVAKSSKHPDAERIYKGVRARVPPVSLDTVYRTLWLLVDLGLITTLGASRERARFDANMRSHHHFVCLTCGMTRDFYSADLDQLRIPESVRELGTVEKTQVQIRGVCLRCRKKKGSA